MENYKYLAIGPFTWGKGTTVDEAFKNVKRNWIQQYAGNFSKEKCVVYEIHPDTEVNGLGDLSYPINHKPKKIFTGKHLEGKDDKTMEKWR